MSIEKLKFDNSNFKNQDVTSLPDKPSAAGYSAEQIKARFDNIPKIMIALGSFNDLIDALLAPSGVNEIGCNGKTLSAFLTDLSKSVDTIEIYNHADATHKKFWISTMNEYNKLTLNQKADSSYIRFIEEE